MLLDILKTIPETREVYARQYDLAHILLFSVLAIMSGSHSYRMIHTFIKTHFDTLKEHYDISWRQPPAYTTIRNIIHTVQKDELEKAFRIHARQLTSHLEGKHLCMDGKVLKGSFDHMNDQAMLQVFSVFLAQEQLILAHETIKNHKTNEIPTAQQLIKDLGLRDVVYTLDAMHCQKKRCKY